METEENSLKALAKADLALQEIHAKVQPFLDRLSSDTAATTTSQQQRRKRALTQAAVALSVGTIRFMGARLRGVDQGRQAGDPLRQDLNKIRKLLVSLQKQTPNKKKQKSNLSQSQTAEKVAETQTYEASKDNVKSSDEKPEGSTPLSGSKRKAEASAESSDFGAASSASMSKRSKKDGKFQP